MNNSVKILALLLLLSACIPGGSSVEKRGENSNERVGAVDDEKPNNVIQPYRAMSNSIEKNGAQRIHYSDLTILLEAIEMGWENMYRTGNDSIYITDKDTAYFNLFPGDWFYDKKFEVEQSEFDKIELYEKISYKMAMNSNRSIEVPFCVISNWKTFESEWRQIQGDHEELKFMSNEEDIHAVINFTVEEFKAAVKEHCGIEWYNEIKNIQSKDKLPSELFITTYIFKIVARKSKTGEVIKKFIVFTTPTSC